MAQTPLRLSGGGPLGVAVLLAPSRLSPACVRTPSTRRPTLDIYIYIYIIVGENRRRCCGVPSGEFCLASRRVKTNPIIACQGLFPTVAIRAPRLMPGDAQGWVSDPGRLEVVSAASPQLPGLPSTGVMRDPPTTRKGNDGGSLATHMRSSGNLPVTRPDTPWVCWGLIFLRPTSRPGL